MPITDETTLQSFEYNGGVTFISLLHTTAGPTRSNPDQESRKYPIRLKFLGQLSETEVQSMVDKFLEGRYVGMENGRLHFGSYLNQYLNEDTKERIEQSSGAPFEVEGFFPGRVRGSLFAMYMGPDLDKKES